MAERLTVAIAKKHQKAVGHVVDAKKDRIQNDLLKGINDVLNERKERLSDSNVEKKENKIIENLKNYGFESSMALREAKRTTLAKKQDDSR